MHSLPVLHSFRPLFHQPSAVAVQPSVVAAQPSSVLESWHALLVAAFLARFWEAFHIVQVADQRKGAHYQERSLIFDPYPTIISSNAKDIQLRSSSSILDTEQKKKN